MAWIYLAESEDSPWRSNPGSDQSHIVNEIDSAMLCFCLGCDCASFLTLLSGTILRASDRPCCPDMKAWPRMVRARIDGALLDYRRKSE